MFQWHERMARAMWNSILKRGVENSETVFFTLHNHFLRNPILRGGKILASSFFTFAAKKLNERESFICLVSVPNMHRISHDNNIDAARLCVCSAWARPGSFSPIFCSLKISSFIYVNWLVWSVGRSLYARSARPNISLLLSWQWITMHSFTHFCSLIATHIFFLSRSHLNDLWTEFR